MTLARITESELIFLLTKNVIATCLKICNRRLISPTLGIRGKIFFALTKSKTTLFWPHRFYYT